MILNLSTYKSTLGKINPHFVLILHETSSSALVFPIFTIQTGFPISLHNSTILKPEYTCNELPSTSNESDLLIWFWTFCLVSEGTLSPKNTISGWSIPPLHWMHLGSLKLLSWSSVRSTSPSGAISEAWPSQLGLRWWINS